MATDDRSGKYPDISGVFDINDSEVPTNIIIKKQPESSARPGGPVLFRQEGASRAPAAETEPRRPSAEVRREPAARKSAPDRPAAQSRESILLRQPDTVEGRKEQKLEQQERQRVREENRRKKQRMMLIRRGVLLGILAVLIVILLAAVLHKPTPEVLIERVREATVEASFSVNAALIQDPAGNGEERVYAVAALAPEQAALTEVGGKVNLLYADDKVVTGIVSELLEEAADSSLLETLGTLLPDITVPAEGLTVAVMLPDDPAAVESGDTASAQIVTQTSKQVLTVPRGALRTDGTSVYVWVYNSKGVSKKLERRAVTIGLMSDTNAEVAEGLEAGEAVVTGCTLAPDALKDGMKVKLAKTEE